MNSGKIELSEKEIIEILFNFIKDNFDNFRHRKKQGEKNWWHNHNYGKRTGKRGDSWAPFVQACFIIQGEKLNYKIGECRTFNNLMDFMKSINHPYGADGHPKYPCRCYDISWVNDAGELFLALEHEESANKPNGGTADKQLKAIYEELEKLRYYKGKFKVIVSRPHLQRSMNNYSNLLIHFKTKITDELSKIKPCPEEKWIIILIAHSDDIKNPGETTTIRFCCYEWQNTELSLIDGNYSFDVKMDNNYNIKLSTSP